MKTHENSVTLYEPAVLYQREKPFKCNLCGRAFSRNCDLTRHMKNHEESLSQPAESMTVTLPLPPATPTSLTIAHEKPFKCNLCGSVFSINSELTKHMKKHKGLLQQHEDTKIFLPQSNGASSIISQPAPTQHLQTQPLIQQHQQQLHSDRPYVCSLCNRSFSRNGDLTRHMRSHPENPLNCKECLKAFTEKSDAGMHEMIHAALMPHVCETCGKAFSSVNHLERHKRVHTQEKPFVCDICSKAFVQKYHMTVHKRTHTGERPFKCELCGFAFTRKDHLVRHQRDNKGNGKLSCIPQNALPNHLSLQPLSHDEQQLQQEQQQQELQLQQEQQQQELQQQLQQEQQQQEIQQQLQQEQHQQELLQQEQQQQELQLQQEEQELEQERQQQQELQLQQEQQELQQQLQQEQQQLQQEHQQQEELQHHQEIHHHHPHQETLIVVHEPHLLPEDDLDHQPLQQMVEIQTEEHGDDDLTPRDPSEVPHYMNI